MRNAGAAYDRSAHRRRYETSVRASWQATLDAHREGAINPMRERIASHLDPLLAAKRVEPEFPVWSHGVGANVDVVEPLFIGRAGRVGGTLQCRIAAIGEFRVRPFAAVGAGDQHQ